MIVSNPNFYRANLTILRAAGIAYTPYGNYLLLEPGKNPMWFERQNEWQQFLKRMAVFNQSWKCMCGKPITNNGELHHALITKGDISGHSEMYLIHDSRNVIVLHTWCHRRWQGDRETCYNYLQGLFGEQVVDNWLINIRNHFNLRSVV